MSWKGFTKAVARLPQRVLQKAGYAEETADPDFEQAEAVFKELEHAAKTLMEDTRSYTNAVKGMLTHQRAIGASLQAVYGAFEDNTKSPLEQCVNEYVTAASDWNETQSHQQEERLQRCVVAPAESLLTIIKHVRATIDKRNRKHIDYDRHLTSVKKAREKNSSDLIKAEQAFNEAKAQFDTYNNMLKEQIPVLYTLRVSFMDPLMESLIHFQIGFFEQIVNLMTPLTSYLTVSADITETHKAQIAPVLEVLATFHIFNPRLIDPSAAVPGLEPPKDSAASSATAGSRDDRRSSVTVEKRSPVMGAAPASPVVAVAAAAEPLPAYTETPSDVVARAVALYPFVSDTEGDLNFDKDEQIDIIQMTGSTDDWWTGRKGGMVGIFPANYVRVL